MPAETSRHKSYLQKSQVHSFLCKTSRSAIAERPCCRVG